MASSLNEIKSGCVIKGIVSNGAVTVTNVEWHGDAAMTVYYTDCNGQLDHRLIYRGDEAAFEIMSNQILWGFDADADKTRLVSEAYRISLAHLFDPYLAVHTSSVEPLPHQISAVYQEMLPKLPLRYVLADDPGAGKTIMTGLLLKELIIRGDLKKCLIVSPGSLAEQWQDELLSKFNLNFTIVTNDLIETAATGNVFFEHDLCIVRLDKMARSEELQNKFKALDWDLVVVDEAHKMSATVWGGEVKKTARFALGELLSKYTRNFLLLTATPHNGKEEDFQLFMSLIDGERFVGAARNSHHSIDVSDVMRRLVKEDLLKFDGLPLFPERIAETVNYTLSDEEAELYNDVTQYVRGEFNKADNLNNERKNTVGFALTILQRRLASSPEAIYQSLHRRRERLENRLAEEKLGKRAAETKVVIYSDFDEDDFTSSELENDEDDITDRASAASTIPELEAEIAILKELEEKANKVRCSGKDRKWDELATLLHDNEAMYTPNKQREKLIIFTEHRDTLNYLKHKISNLIGEPEAVVTIHGGMLRDERRKVESLFKQDKDVRILLATDAAGEGLNLQRAHLMINYDLPWNPNRLEQRFGRIHRIGQTEVCHLWNLVSKETREGMVYQRLLEKLEQEREALGGKVFDILGKLTFENKSLRDLLIEAIRYDNQEEVRAKLFKVVDRSLDIQKLRDLLNARALTEDTMDTSKVDLIREEMERAEAHKLQPHFIESFFLEAFKELGGQIKKREKNRYEITFVPSSIRNTDREIGSREPVLRRYDRVCFDKAYSTLPGEVIATFICPGHPLLDAVISLIKERYSSTLKQGTIYIDEKDFSKTPRLLFYIEDTIRDGKILASGAKREISKRFHFVELLPDGSAINAGYAPYLDYRSPNPDELAKIATYRSTFEWISKDVKEKAENYAITTLLPKHLNEVRERKNKALDKIESAVRERLTLEINHWDSRASELAAREAAGKITNNLNSEKARMRADELANRLERRMQEIKEERLISAQPPNIVSGALIIPRGLLSELMGETSADLFAKSDTKGVEMAAMNAVMKRERRSGFSPRDVSKENIGYDIESSVPEELRKNGRSLRFIEVKGRSKGATTVTITKNEILTALNEKERFILAIVEVDGDETKTIYLKNPFKLVPQFSVNSVNFDIKNLISDSEIEE